jgi:GNAT superfamily N-acetyltransferase
MRSKWLLRSYQEGDEEKIFELVKAMQGERVPEKERWLKGWKWMFVDNPDNASIIWLAEHDGKIVGQYPAIIETLKVGDKVMKGAQLIDTMTHPQYRHRGIFSTLGDKALTELENGETHLVYCFPTQQVYPLHIKSGWLDICAFRVMIKPLNLKKFLQKYFIRNRFLLDIFTVGGNLIIKAFFRSKKVPEGDMSKVREIARFDDRINGFWNTVSKDYSIIRIRDKKYLNWRYVDAPNADYTIYIAEEDDKISGYIVLGCRNENSLMWGHIEDIIALTGRSDIIQCLIAKAIEYFRDAKVDAIFSKMIANEVYRKRFLRNGFIPHFRFKGRFITYNASTELSGEYLKNPDNWFIQQGDLPGVY